MKTRQLAAYGALGLPLAFAALPLYVLVPDFYSRQLGLALPVIGSVLFFTRLLDTLQDPFLGLWVDRLAQRRQLASALKLAMLLLGAGFVALWQAPGGSPHLATWLSLSLVTVYLGHSFLNIALMAWGSRLSPNPDDLARAAAWREGCALVGVILASLLPTVLLQWSSQGMAVFSGLFGLLLMAGVGMLLTQAPPWQISHAQQRPLWQLGWQDRAISRLLAAFFLNGLASAIAATLSLFFIADHLAAKPWSGLFLAIYFLAGAISLPGWVGLSRQIGAAASWRCAMTLALLAFAGVGLLGPGDLWAYGLVCLLTGLALGADLALPPVLLAARLPTSEPMAAWFGVWSLLAKLTLALAGLLLPLLSYLHYQPGVAGSTSALVWLYGGLPCLCKLLALGLMVERATDRQPRPAAAIAETGGTP